MHRNNYFETVKSDTGQPHLLSNSTYSNTYQTHKVLFSQLSSLQYTSCSDMPPNTISKTCQKASNFSTKISQNTEVIWQTLECRPVLYLQISDGSGGRLKTTRVSGSLRLSSLCGRAIPIKIRHVVQLSKWRHLATNRCRPWQVAESDICWIVFPLTFLGDTCRPLQSLGRFANAKTTSTKKSVYIAQKHRFTYRRSDTSSRPDGHTSIIIWFRDSGLRQ